MKSRKVPTRTKSVALESATELPKITVVIPTYNEEKNIGRCLDAIVGQDYSKNRLEILVVDNRSTDNTVEIVESYARENPNLRLLFNDIAKDAEISKAIGLRVATGHLFLYLDADIEIVGKMWFSELVKPMINDPELAGSFSRFLPKSTDAAIGRFLRYHPLELDPVFQFFCTEISDTIVSDKGQYLLCYMQPSKTPPIGICAYRKNILLKVVGNMQKFMDIDVPVLLSKNGYNKFAYVPSCGIYHVNVRSLRDLIRKRLRNINRVYLPNAESREFKYFDLTTWKGVLKVFLWVIYANSFIPKLAEGVFKTFKNRDLACMYEPIVALVLTDVIILSFLRRPEGRTLVLNGIKTLIKG